MFDWYLAPFLYMNHLKIHNSYITVYLKSAALIISEKDVDSDVLWTWSYPSITQTFRKIILRKCCLKTDKEEIIPFCFGQFNKQWFYIYTSEVKNSEALSKVGCHSSLFFMDNPHHHPGPSPPPNSSG